MKSSSVDCLRSPNGNTENKQEIADLFNKHFTSIADCLKSLLAKVAHDFSRLRNFVATKLDGDAMFKIPKMTIIYNDTLKALKNLKSCKSTGLDNISVRFLKIVAPKYSTFYYENHEHIPKYCGISNKMEDSNSCPTL